MIIIIIIIIADRQESLKRAVVKWPALSTELAVWQGIQRQLPEADNKEQQHKTQQRINNT